MYLKRYHDITIGQSGVWRILKRLDLNRLPASQRYQRHDRRWKRYEKHYQYTAIDDCHLHPEWDSSRTSSTSSYYQVAGVARIGVESLAITTNVCANGAAAALVTAGCGGNGS